MTRFLFLGVIGLILNVFFCSYALATGPLGSTPNFSRIPINPDESAGEIVAISQDNLGFLWFGGRRGLARYDGYRIHTYKANARDPNALGDDRITEVFKDSRGEMWVATANAGVARLNRSQDNFITYKIEKIKDGKTLTQNFTEIIEDQHQNLWIVGGDGVALYDRKQDTFTRYLTQSPIINSPILKMLNIQGDEFFLVTAEAVFIWNKASGELTKFQPEAKDTKSLPLNLTRSVLKDSKGTIWIGHEKGLHKFNPRDKTFEAVPLKNVVENIKSVTIWKIIEDKNGILWMGTDGNGLMYFDPATHVFGSYTRTVSPSSLGAPVVRTVFEDNVGDLWVSTFPAGLYHYNQTNNYFAYYANFIKSPAGLYANTTWAFAEDAEQNIWLGIDSLGLVYFDRKTNNFSQTYKGFNFSEHRFPHTVLSLLKDSRGNLWMGTWAQGVSRFNLNTLTYQHFDPNLNDSSSVNGSEFEGDSVWSMLEAKNGDIYFGTMNHGIIHYSYVTNQFTTYKNNHDGDKSPNNNIGWSLLEDDKGRIWVGTNRGINVFDPATKRFSYYQHKPKDTNSLSSDQANWFYKDSKGRIWICTVDGGLSLYQPQSDSFTNIGALHGLKNNDLQAMVEDNNGLLWLTNTNNITSLNPDTLEMHSYTDKSWIQNGEFNHGAAYKLSSGELMFAGANGFNILNPDRVTSNRAKPKVFFTELELLNENILPSSRNRVLRGDILMAPQITLTHEDPMFSLRFTATNYRSYAENTYTYKLEGFDTQWHRQSPNNKATYTHLDAGRYRFVVRAANNDNLWGDEETAIDIVVLPAPWKTWWAYCIYSALAAGLVAWYVIAQNQKYSRQKRLNYKLKELDALKDDFMANTSHELRTPVNGIIGITQALQDGIAGNQSAATLHHLGMILNCGRRLERLINDVLDFSTAKTASLQLVCENFNITAVIADVVRECAPNIESDQVKLINRATADYPLLFGDAERTRRIIYNLLVNAIKYTQQGQITLDVEIMPDFLCIKVQDTGIGISQEQLPKIYESFTQIAASGALTKNGTGLGLSIAKYFTEAQGGQLRVDSKPGEGTLFSVLLKQASPEQLAEHDRHSQGSNIDTATGQERTTAGATATAMAEIASKSTNGALQEQAPAESLLPVFFPKNYQPTAVHKKILVVDDEAINRTILRSQGLRYGFIIYEAANGQQALEALNGGLTCDLILLDIMMPKLSGIETCRLIRDKYSREQLPIVFVSAKTQPSDIDECFRAQGNDFLAKPVNREELISCMEKYLKQAPLNRMAG